MSAVELPITIEQGATFFLDFIWANDAEGADPVDLTGASMKMQIRKSQQAILLAEATSDGVAPYITLGGMAGLVSIKIPASITSALPVKSAKYDMEATMVNGDVYRVVGGPVTVTPNITQIDGEPILT